MFKGTFEMKKMTHVFCTDSYCLDVEIRQRVCVCVCVCVCACMRTHVHRCVCKR